MTDKNTKISRAEKIANDFLLQFAYAIASSIFLLFIYNATLFTYGGKIGLAMPRVLWVLFGLFAVSAAVMSVLWRVRGRNGFKIAAIYLAATAVGLFWCVGVQGIAAVLSRFIPIPPYFVNTKRLMDMLFILIGLSVVVEIGVYFYRMKRLREPAAKPSKIKKKA